MDDRTDVTINPSDYDTDIIEEDKTDLDPPPQRGITVKQNVAQSKKTLLTLSTEQTQLLRDVMKELNTANPGGRSVLVWDLNIGRSKYGLFAASVKEKLPADNIKAGVWEIIPALLN